MFLFIPCQVGCERVLKEEIRELYNFNSAFSRAGFVTFKVPDELCVDDGGETIRLLMTHLANNSIFARTVSIFLGKLYMSGDFEIPETEHVTATSQSGCSRTKHTDHTSLNISAENLVESIWQLISAPKPAAPIGYGISSAVSQPKYFINRVHVFSRDCLMTGQNGFEPAVSSDLVELHSKLVSGCPFPKFLGVGSERFDQPAFVGETVLDVVRVDVDSYTQVNSKFPKLNMETQQCEAVVQEQILTPIPASVYFVGVHFVTEESPIHSLYSGGILPIQLPTDAVSRAWLKFEEGLRWSGISIDAGASCVDIGAAPGGGSQVLLSRGAIVLGVDPAEVAPIVLNNPNFKHIRGRINQTQRFLYKNVRWVIADINVAPKYTLDVLEDVLKYNSKINGMLFTLKLSTLELAKHIPQFVKRIRKWDFNNIKVKQLVFNRHEVMVAVKK
ncbi:MAG: hypothetical protein LBJ00_00400 [Planctomycetaceae bacterium]|jgi:hypothetical protein|nr:hypothetical protein [Planctomycetaceae bacterium]